MCIFLMISTLENALQGKVMFFSPLAAVFLQPFDKATHEQISEKLAAPGKLST